MAETAKRQTQTITPVNTSRHLVKYKYAVIWKKQVVLVVGAASSRDHLIRQRRTRV
jgi:hypothetical protein